MFILPRNVNVISLVWSSGRSWSQRLYFLPEKRGHKHRSGARGREVKEEVWVINDHSPTIKEGIFAGDVNYIPIFREASALTHVTMSARSWACCSGNTVEGCDGQTMCGFLDMWKRYRSVKLRLFSLHCTLERCTFETNSTCLFLMEKGIWWIMFLIFFTMFFFFLYIWKDCEIKGPLNLHLCWFQPFFIKCITMIACCSCNELVDMQIHSRELWILYQQEQNAFSHWFVLTKNWPYPNVSLL